MRKLFTILAFFGLVVGISAQGAHADSVTYTVSSSYSSDVPMSSVSNPSSPFKLVFTVPLTVTGNFGPSGTQGFVDVPSVDVTFSSPGLASFTALADLTFNPNPLPGGGFYPGLFSIVVNGF